MTLHQSSDDFYIDIEPDVCSTAIVQSDNLMVTGQSVYATFSYRGPGGTDYGIGEDVAAFPDASSAQRMFAKIADGVRACGNTSGTLAAIVSLKETGPFSIELGDTTASSLRWTFSTRHFFLRDPSLYPTESMLAVVNNMIVHVSASRFTDAAPLTTALMQAISQRIASAH